MNKELEALNCIEKVNDYLKNVYDYKEIKEEIQKDVNTIKQALFELNSIKEVNPSEALKCLERIDKEYLTIESEDFSNCFNTIKQVLLKAQEQEKENEFLLSTTTTVNKQYTDLMLTYQEQKRVLEIIKVKPIESGIAIEQIKNQRDLTYSQYKKAIVELSEAYLLTEEEFNLLKKHFLKEVK